MIYCKLKNKSDYSAIYCFGNTTDNMTGLMRFSKGHLEPTIIKKPDNDYFSYRKVVQVVRKYKDFISRGEYPDKMAYEIG